MPECVEVQRIVGQIRPLVLGSMIRRYRSLHHCFREMPTNVTVVDMRRHGKWQIWELSDGRALTINLGMSGNFRFGPPLHKHARWIAQLERDGQRLLMQFVDPRCMGRLKLIPREQAAELMDDRSPTRGIPSLGLGPDVMCRALRDRTPSEQVVKWREMLRAPLTLKHALMSQHVVAGLGNIYATEACWRARAHPLRRCADLTDRQLKLLAVETPRMLRRALELGGTALGDANSFRGIDGDGADGSEGRAQRLLRAYGRAGKPCSRCGTIIQKIRERGRTTYWCPGCQE